MDEKLLEPVPEVPKKDKGYKLTENMDAKKFYQF